MAKNSTPSMFDMYKPKKKRAVDPNAPPRPNLLSHEKVIKDAKLTIEQQGTELSRLRARLEEVERKLNNQTTYLNGVHQTLQALQSKVNSMTNNHSKF